jgi:hypothetical protein
MTIIKKIALDVYIVSWALFKVLIPTLIVVKIAEAAGAVYWLNIAMAPIVTLIGLPADMAIVLTTTMLTNPYAGLMLLSATPTAASLSVAQTTIIASFMLFAHSLPVEAAITRNAGLRVGVTLIVRVGAAILFCALLNLFFSQFNLLGETANLHLPQFDATPSLMQWTLDQIKGLVFIQGVIVVLIIGLELLRWIGVERLIQKMMHPILVLVGIGSRASTIVIVGLTLGLGFGGGLMIKDVRQGMIPAQAAVGSLVLINLYHSVFEDTAVMLLLGPSLFYILVVRGVFALILTYLIIRILGLLSEPKYDRWVVNTKAFGAN